MPNGRKWTPVASRPTRSGSGKPADRSQLQISFDRCERTSGAVHRRVRCRQCRKSFKHPVWYAEEGLRLFFCGAACRRKWERDIGTPHVRVRLTGRPKHRGGNWDAIVERIRQRDGHRCRGCGADEAVLPRRLDVHHRIPVRLFSSSSEANREENLVAVCPSCHARMEELGRRDLSLFDHVPHPGKHHPDWPEHL
jgi:5-methylcytosine-specific restriction endonuclease McrA